jgi:hypothetical protein
MSHLLEELRETCCRFMNGVFKLKCREEDAERLERKTKERACVSDIPPFENPWMKPPTE